jgi:hypothetical protein
VSIACPAATDVAPVSLASVTVTAASTGSPVTRFGSGIHLAGNCPVAMSAVNVTGAVVGVLAEAAAPATMTDGSVSQNGTGVEVGAAGAAAPSFSATRTAFQSNAGDAVYVLRGTFSSDACPYADNGTHVHAEPSGTATLNLTVRGSTMTGATNSAMRLLAMGAASVLSLSNNVVVGNSASTDYNVASGLRRGGGLVLTPPLPGTSAIRGTTFARNKYDQFLVAADRGSLDVRGDTNRDGMCGVLANTFACFDGTYVGVYSNGAAVDASWNHWSQQPGALGIDAGGIGVIGYATSACPAATISCQ